MTHSARFSLTSQTATATCVSVYVTVCALLGCQGAPAPSRTVSGSFLIAYQPETGARTTVPAAPLSDWVTERYHLSLGYRLESLLVPDSAPHGYSAFPATLAPDFTFSVPGVPVGRYFMVLSSGCVQSGTQIMVKCLELIEMTASTPDLSTANPCRPNAAGPAQATNVALEINGLQPWNSGDYLAFVSSQACLEASTTWDVPPRPPEGATSFASPMPWRDALPDAAKGDVVFLYQKSRGLLGGGAAESRAAVRFVRLTDFSLPDGSTASLHAGLSAPPTGTLRLDLRWSQFASLAPDVYPTATPSADPSFSPSVGILAVPQNTRAMGMAASLASALVRTGPRNADADYGSLAYGQFLDASWRQLRKVEYFYDVSIEQPGSMGPIFRRVQTTQRAWVSTLSGAVVPLLSPPRVPRINGMDAFRTRTGVGTQPILSWSAPTIGTPSSYIVSIEEIAPVAGATASITATVRSGTSFLVPPGLLTPERHYVATIAAVLASGDADRLETDVDQSDASCVTAVFSP